MIVTNNARVLLFTALTNGCMRVAVAASGGWPSARPARARVDQALLFARFAIPSSLGDDDAPLLGRARLARKNPEGGYRHLIIASMFRLPCTCRTPAWAANNARSTRGEVLNPFCTRRERPGAHQASAFYTDAKAVVIDTFDMEVVRNALDDLPLDLAFEVGKTESSKASAVRRTRQTWQPDSTTLVVVSDGDTVPDSGMPEMPRSIQRTIIVGVGDSRTGTFIDGHQSRQDSPPCAGRRPPARKIF